MKKGKWGFLNKLFLVISDFRTYPFLVKHENIWKSLLYLITLVFIVSTIITTSMIVKFSDLTNELKDSYDDMVPEFELINGKLTVNGKYNEKINDEAYLVVNTDYTYDEFKNTKEYAELIIYDTVLFVNNDKIIIEFDDEGPLYEIPFVEIPYSLNKQAVYNELTREYGLDEYISTFVLLYLAIFIGYFIAMCVKIFMLTFVIILICALSGVKLNFSNYIKIAIYTYTLPIIVEMIAYSMVGSIKDYAYYTILLLNYIYIIYAIRAIRLDAVISIFSEKADPSRTPEGFEREYKKYSDLESEIEKANEPANKNDEENKDKK